MERALATAPAGFTVAGRRPGTTSRVGAGAEPVLCSASGPAFVLERGERRHGTLADVRDAVAVAHQTANVDVYGIAIAPLDVPEERRPQVMAHAIATGTDKPSRVDVTTELELQVATRRRRDPLRRRLARAAAPVDRHQHDLAAAALGRGGPGAAAPVAPRPAGLSHGLRHGRHHGAVHAARPARRAARRAAHRPRAQPARPAGLPVPVRRHLVDVVDAHRRAAHGRARVLAADRGDRRPGPSARRAGAGRRRAHRRPHARRPGRGRVGSRAWTPPCGPASTSCCTRPASSRRSTRSRWPSSCSTTSCSARCAALTGPSWSTRRRWPSTS